MNPSHTELAARARKLADALYEIGAEHTEDQEAIDLLRQCAAALESPERVQGEPRKADMLEVPITAPGMVKAGDTVCFTLSGKRVRETVKLVLDAGTDREELIYNKKRNYYLITSMCMAGTGSQKNVCVLREFAPTPPTAPAQDAQGISGKEKSNG